MSQAKKTLPKGISDINWNYTVCNFSLENAEYTGHSLSVLRKIADVTSEPLSTFIENEEPRTKDPKILELHILPILKEYKSFLWLDACSNHRKEASCLKKSGY